MGLGTWWSFIILWVPTLRIPNSFWGGTWVPKTTPNFKSWRYYIYKSMESSPFCNCFFWGKLGFKFQRSCGSQLSLKLGGPDSCILSSLLKKCIMLLTFHVSENERQKQTFGCFGILKGKPVWILRMSPFFQLYAQETCGASTSTVGLIFAVMPSACFIGEGPWCRFGQLPMGFQVYNMASVYFAPGPFKLWCGLWQGSVVTVVINMKHLRTWWTSFNRFRI